MSLSQSTMSSRMRLFQSRRKAKSTASALASRKALKVYDGGYDVTPKPLVHEHYPGVEDKQTNVLDTMNLKQRSSSIAMMIGPAGYRSSSALIRSHSIHTTAAIFDEPMESLNSVHAEDSLSRDDSDRAPSPFCLPR